MVVKVQNFISDTRERKLDLGSCGEDWKTDKQAGIVRVRARTTNVLKEFHRSVNPRVVCKIEESRRKGTSASSGSSASHEFS